MATAEGGKMRRSRALPIAIGLVILAALGFIAFSIMGDLEPEAVDTSAGKTFPCTVVSVYDGDGPINCAEVDLKGQQVRVRVRGIEARDADNTCSSPDLCPAATGEQGKDALTKLAVGRLTCVSHGPSYSRVNAGCRTASGADLACEMLKTGTAVRWPAYDPEGKLLACVPGRR